MSVDLNHIIVYVRDKWASAEFLAGILGLKAGPLWAHFVPVRTANGVTIDFTESANMRTQQLRLPGQRGRVRRGAGPPQELGREIPCRVRRHRAGRDQRAYGGRGVYFNDANGHVFELVTRPYGDVPEQWIDGRAVTSAH